MRLLIQTACYLVGDGITATIRKLEAHILSTYPDASICILTTGSGDATMLDRYLDLVEEGKRESIRSRRTVIFAASLKMPVASETGYELGLGLSAADLSSISSFSPTAIHITVPDFIR